MTNQPLFSYTNQVDPAESGAKIMIVTLGSYVDAGHAQTLLDAHLLGTLRNYEIGRFDVDQLLDYRDNRPPITFERDHFTGYQPPRISLHHLLDDSDEPFLLLAGPEPALQWNRLTDEIEQLVDDLHVDLVVTVQGMPFPTPHTRPTIVTRMASDPSLLKDNQPLFDVAQMGASYPAVLATKLAEDDHRVLGLVAHIPHYVAQSDYPNGALALLDEINRLTVLNLPAAGLPVAATIIRDQIDAQVVENEEVQELVQGLERRYDAMAKARLMLPTAERLPSADEIGAEAEAFLRNLDMNAPRDLDVHLPPSTGEPGNPRLDGSSDGDHDEDPQQG